MKKFIILFIIFVHSSVGYAQIVPVVGVSQFSCQENSPYTGLVTEKVVEMLTNSKRFKVVDRTSRADVEAELELQKREEFIDSKNLAQQGVSVGAEKIISGHIVKIPVYRVKNSFGETRGYKASVAFQMKIVDVATGVSTEATSFQGKASDEYLSPESAVTAAMNSLQNEIYEYFRLNFPVQANISRLLESDERKGIASLILLNAGSSQGVKKGDKFIVESIEMIEGKAFPTTIGEVVVKELAGEAFSKCEVNKKIGSAIYQAFNDKSNIICRLVIKK